MKTVDCVERKGKYVYFTVVMAEGKEIDFRCAQEQGWNAAITLQMVQYKNRQAILAVRSAPAARRPDPLRAAAPLCGGQRPQRDRAQRLGMEPGAAPKRFSPFIYGPRDGASGVTGLRGDVMCAGCIPGHTDLVLSPAHSSAAAPLCLALRWP
uniref:Pleckstrin homology-like domain family A member 1 n=1 Tax=Chrysolophus pictus TaxID=9089 RepID=A0A8C3LPZ0_CHRPC